MWGEGFGGGCGGCEIEEIKKGHFILRGKSVCVRAHSNDWGDAGTGNSLFSAIRNSGLKPEMS